MPVTDEELQQIEEAAADMARNAGKILLDYFSGPLEIDYKSPNRRDAVTNADRASDVYIRAEVHRRFPQHSVLSEEGDDDKELRSKVTWVIDPLDGTNNFLNGMPMFGVSIGVLEGDRPVVGALFVPSIRTLEGSVYHARIGGGAHRDGAPLFLGNGEKPRNALLASMPTYFPHAFKFKPSVRWNLGEVRSTGSVAYEMAMVCQGVLQYAVFNGPQIWDLAAGMVLVPEAGGMVLLHRRRSRDWWPFEHIEVRHTSEPPSHGELRTWRPLVIIGTQEATGFVASGMSPQRYRIRRLWWRFKRLFRKPAPQAQAEEPAATKTQGANGVPPLDVRSTKARLKTKRAPRR
jgi:myo-inositol-1(or 4)-monophosphatase